MRRLSLNLWGSDCGYIANNVSYPGKWLGPAIVTLQPLTCSSYFSPQGLSLTFGATSATPNGQFSVPPFTLSVKLQDVNGAVTGLATGGEIMSYLTSLGTTSTGADVTQTPAADVTWTYYPPPALQVHAQ